MSIPETRPRVVAFGSGKGGAGKSLLASNVAIYLATLGKRVVLIDAALGSANLHTFLGGARPQRNLAEVFGKAGARLDDIAEPTRVPGLRLVAGERDPGWAANPRGGQLRRLADQIPEVEADYVVLDLGAGTSNNLVELFLLADVGVLVAIPEPTSVELCYRFIRSAFLRLLAREGLAEAVKFQAHELRHFEGGMPAPLDLHEEALERDAAVAAKIERAILSFCPSLIINMARSKADMDLGHAIAAAGRRRLGTPIYYLGHAEYDEAVWVALRRKRPLLVEHPESRVAKCIEKVTRRIIARETDRSAPTSVQVGESHYDLLEVAPTASFEDIRRANRRIREVYGADSVVTSGLFTLERLELLHKRLDDAYRTLMDSAKRKDYDQELFPEGIPSQSILGETPPAAIDRVPVERPPMPALSPDTVYSGPLLQQIREAAGIELRSIAEQSKIGMTYLRAIEGEDFDKLPATVYVRGFLVEYAKILKLDVGRVLQSFLERYKAGRAGTEP